VEVPIPVEEAQLEVPAELSKATLPRDGEDHHALALLGGEPEVVGLRRTAQGQTQGKGEGGSGGRTTRGLQSVEPGGMKKAARGGGLKTKDKPGLSGSSPADPWSWDVAAMRRGFLLTPCTHKPASEQP